MKDSQEVLQPTSLVGEEWYPELHRKQSTIPEIRVFSGGKMEHTERQWMYVEEKAMASRLLSSKVTTFSNVKIFSNRKIP